jgi:integrase
MARQRRGFGKIRKLPSGRYQASYIGPDGGRHVAETTFLRKLDAEAWLAARQAELIESRWRPPTPTAVPLREYAPAWLAARRSKSGQPLKASTQRDYQRLVRTIVAAPFAAMPVNEITSGDIQAWYDGMESTTGAVSRLHTFSLLKTIFNTATRRKLRPDNPCADVEGAAKPKRQIIPHAITPTEVEALSAAMPARLAMAVTLAAWSSLRLGELFDLRRDDLDLDLTTGYGAVRVDSAVYRVGRAAIIDRPKTEAGVRTVPLPPHILPALAAHLDTYAAPGKRGLVFPASTDPSAHMPSSSLDRHWRKAKAAAGLQLRWHDLRHTGQTYATLAGATPAELQKRAGHATAQMALAYQHVLSGRPQEIAQRMSDLAAAPDATVTNLSRARRRKAG